MINQHIEQLRRDIIAHESNRKYTEKNFMPLFQASPGSKIVIIGQAPGIKAQTSGIPWDDASGTRLMDWLGVSEEQFRNPAIFGHVPMDFYYPGKGKSGDLPPRKTFAPLWHRRLRDYMPEVELTILIGRYAQEYYLKKNSHHNLTERVRNYEEYLPDYLPLVHPSPLNFRWFAKNEWFEDELIPILQKLVAEIIIN